MHWTKRALALLLCGASLLLAACGTGGGESSAQTQKAMGRYVEEALALPEDMYSLVYFNAEDSQNLFLLGSFATGDAAQYEMRAYRSADGGESWQPDTPEWLEAVRDVQLYTLTLDADGTPYFTYMKDDPAYVQETPDASEAPDSSDSSEMPEVAENPAAPGPAESGAEPDPSGMSEEDLSALMDEMGGEEGEEGSSTLFFGDLPEVGFAKYENGEVVELPYTLTLSNGYDAEAISFLSNGDLIACYYNELQIVDLATGEVKQSITSESRLYEGFYFESGGQLAVVDGDTLKYYPLSGGAVQREVALQNENPGANPDDMVWTPSSMIAGQTSVCPVADTDSFYYANKGGIYRTQGDGGPSEKIVDGSLNSLCMPSLDIFRLLQKSENEFLALMLDQNSLPQLVRYRYDAETPTVPGSALNVWSLNDSATLRQAINAYQRKNPDIWVQLEVGMNGGAGLTAEDAVKSMVTQLLAGGGPDLIVLDGLPLDSYLQKNMLADLSGKLPAELTEQLYENIAFPLNEEDGLHAVAGRFSMPVILGEEGAAAQLQDPVAMADYLKDSDDIPMFGADIDDVVERLYPLFQSRWFGEDGALNEDVFRQDLEALGSLTQTYNEDEMISSGGDILHACTLREHNLYPFYLGKFQAVGDLAGPYTLGQHGYEDKMEAYPGNGDTLFTPQLLMGVNAQSQNLDTAADFLGTVLSEEIQSYALGDGLPVNRNAMKTLQAGDSSVYVLDGVAMSTTYAVGVTNPETGEGIQSIFSSQWPTDAYFGEIDAMVEGANRPIFADATVQSILSDETLDYLNGEKSLDETMQTLSQKLNLYIAENRQ